MLEDPHAPARGCLLALLWAIPLWVLVGFLIYFIKHGYFA
jgi:hypothetical protein